MNKYSHNELKRLAGKPNVLKYQDQASTQTLEQGIEEYALAFSGQLTSRVVSPEGASFFRCHDAVHVVFGCGLSLEDELVVKVSSLFGTSGGWDVVKGYRLPESKEIYGELEIAEIVTTTVRAFWLTPRTIGRCMKMSAKWPWNDFDGYRHRSLEEIRSQFDIRVAH